MYILLKIYIMHINILVYLYIFFKYGWPINIKFDSYKNMLWRKKYDLI